MAQEPLSTTQLEHWATLLRDNGLSEIALPFIDLLPIWGFVGGQVLWMLTPFWGEARLAPLALALEQPETAHQLRRYLLEGATRL